LRVAGEPEIGAMDGAVLNLGIRTEAIKRPAWTPSNSAIGKLVSFACDESLHGVVSFCGVVSLFHWRRLPLITAPLAGVA